MPLEIGPRDVGDGYDPERYLFKAEALEIIFNRYDVGSYAVSPYTVDIPYGRLTSPIRTNGLLGC